MNRLFLFIALISINVYAKNITTPKPAVIIGAHSDIGKRVCYYEDKSYSIGAVLQVGDYYMVCKAENSYETNSALKWFPLDASKLKE